MNHLPDTLARAVSDVLRAVPHVSGVAQWTHNGVGTQVTLTVRVDGWGPTLHESAYDAQWTYADERRMLAGALNSVRRVAAQQRTLVDIAAGFGLTKPLFRDAPQPLRELVPADAEHVSRLHIESVLADALIADHGPNDAADRIVRCLDTLLTARQTSPEYLRHAGEYLEVDKGRIVIQPSLMIGGPTSASLHGRMLDLRARIPHTLLQAAIGRPLGEVVQTRVVSLDAAPIVETNTYGADSLQLTTASDLVRIGEHPELVRGLATACRWRVAA